MEKDCRRSFLAYFRDFFYRLYLSQWGVDVHHFHVLVILSRYLLEAIRPLINTRMSICSTIYSLHLTYGYVNSSPLKSKRYG